MSDAPSFSTLSLPPDLDADDLLGFRDQFAARLAAVLRPKGKKRANGRSLNASPSRKNRRSPAARRFLARSRRLIVM